MKTIKFIFGDSYWEEKEYEDDVTVEEIEQDLEEWCLHLSRWEQVD